MSTFVPSISAVVFTPFKVTSVTKLVLEAVPLASICTRVLAAGLDKAQIAIGDRVCVRIIEASQQSGQVQLIRTGAEVCNRVVAVSQRIAEALKSTVLVIYSREHR